MTDAACLVCGSGSNAIRKPIGAGYIARRCNSCKFTWIDRESIKRVGIQPNYDNYDYNNRLTQQYEDMSDKYLLGFNKRVSRTVPESLSDSDKGALKFLDVGCANGEYLRTARHAGIENVYGVEIDEVARKRASKHGHVVASLAELEGMTFDIIQIKNVISNIDDFRGFLREYYNVLAPGGVMWVDVLNQDSLLAFVRNILRPDFRTTGRYGPLRPPYVINGFTKDSIAYLCNELNMSVLGVETSHLGSLYVPYSPPGFLAQGVRIVSTYLGYGSMLICNLRRNGPSD